MSLSEWVGIIGVVVSIIGIIVGVIGAKSLNKANQITAATIGGSTLTQGENVTIINQGSDTYAIMKIAKDVTQAEIAAVMQKLGDVKREINNVKNDVNSMTRIHVGKEKPANMRNGDLWFEVK